MTKNSEASKNAGAEGPLRIGLALSGGGFRASLYHLGTIRYLEKAGIMPRVEVVSTVSGGSTPTAQSKVTAAQKPTADSTEVKATAPGEAASESKKAQGAKNSISESVRRSAENIPS